MTTRVACPAQDTRLDAMNADLMNQALLSAHSSFEQNPAYSSANAEFSSAMDSFPASVTSSLSCSGYSGININSLPPWLTPVPTAVVSIILHEEQVYQSIVSSFEDKNSLELSASPSTQKSTTAFGSSNVPTSGVSVSASPTNLTIPTSSSAAASAIARSFTSGILAAASLILAGLL